MRPRIDMKSFATCAEYNDWLDSWQFEEHGDRQIGLLGVVARASEFTFHNKPDTYQAAFDDFIREWTADLSKLVIDEYPRPIAYPMSRFLTGFENQIQRLQFIRDVWEGIADVLHAFAIGECRFRAVPLHNVGALTFSRVLTDSVAAKLQNVEDMLVHATATGLTLNLVAVVSVSTLKKIRELNQSRNAFSHSTALSEAQATQWVNECIDDVYDVLDDLRELQHVRLLKYSNQPAATTLKAEVFRGHSITKRFKEFTLSQQQLVDCARYLAPGQTLAAYKGLLIGLRPIMYFLDDNTGHTTKPCLFRKTQGDVPNKKLLFAVIGDGTTHAEHRTVFTAELNEIRALFAPDGGTE